MIAVVESPSRRDVILASQIDVVIQQLSVLESLHRLTPKPEMDQKQPSGFAGIFANLFGRKPSVVKGIIPAEPISNQNQNSGALFTKITYQI